jgi:putative MATE family efflux protein
MRNLTEGPEGRVILSFVAPMLIGNVFQQLYTVVDSIVVGQFVGKTALAAVGSSFSIIFLLLALIMGVTMGSGIMISQFYGAKDMEKVKRTISTVYIYVFVASLVITVVGIFLSRPLLRLLRTPDDVLDQAVIYLRIIFGGMLVSFGYNALTAVFRAVGDSRTPLYFLIVATLTNIVLDLVFVLVLNLGVAGVAWATIISQAIAFLLCWIAMQRSPHEVLHFDVRHMTFDRALFVQSMRIGIPSGVQQVLVAMGFMAITRIVNGFGTDTIAGYAAASRLDSFAGMPAMNFSMALVTFVGQNLGARKPERVRKGLLATLLMSSVIAAVVTAVMVGFRGSLIHIFSGDPEVVRIGGRYLAIVGSGYLLFSAMFILGAVPRGAGDTMIPMLITLLTLWVVRIPLSIWLSSFLGSDGIWWSLPAAWLIGAVLSGAYYLSGRWRRRVLVKPAAVPSVVE